MYELNSPDIQFLILIPDSSETKLEFVMNECQNILYSREYSISKIKHYDGSDWLECNLAIKDDDINIENDVQFLFEMTKLNQIIIKHKANKNLIQYNRFGKKRELSIQPYELNTCNQSDIWFYDSKFYCLKNEKSYLILESREQIKLGMVIELLNDNEWIPILVRNIDEQYENTFKLFIKHKKARIEIQ
jgi:hypothetical protein